MRFDPRCGDIPEQNSRQPFEELVARNAAVAVEAMELRNERIAGGEGRISERRVEPPRVDVERPTPIHERLVQIEDDRPHR